MYIVINAGEKQKQEFLSRTLPPGIEISWAKEAFAEANGYFDLLFESNGAAFPAIHDKPVFINEVIGTCTRLPLNFIRLNAWNGFLKRDLAEVTLSEQASPQIKTAAATILIQLGWTPHWVADIPGMVTPRVISMIINEAYFALGDKVSTKEEIDTAMKLGTGYPFGPFEWSEKIGLHKVYRLLKELSRQDSRYDVAPKLEEELKSIA